MGAKKHLKFYEVIFQFWQPFHFIKVCRTENFTSKYPPKCGQTAHMTIFPAKNTQPFSLQSQVFMPGQFFLGLRLKKPGPRVRPPKLT